MEMKAGVPQGSVLSPNLYNLYTSNTLQTIGVNLARYVDDTCIYATERKEGYVLKELQSCLNSDDTVNL
jgi:retron-type reverse transcriptase